MACRTANHDHLETAVLLPGILHQAVDNPRAETVTSSCLLANEVVDTGSVLKRARGGQRPLPVRVVVQEVQLSEPHGLAVYLDYEELRRVRSVDSRAVAALDRLEVVGLAPPRLDMRLRKPQRQQAEIFSLKPPKTELHLADATNSPSELLAAGCGS